MSRYLRFVGLVALSVQVVSRATADETSSKEIAWRTDLEAARKDALKEGKPFLVVFR